MTSPATYSGDPDNSASDEVRFYIGDVDMSDPLLTDAEINFYVTKLNPVFGSNLATAAYLAQILANRFAREVSMSADGVSIQAEELQQKFKQISLDLREQYRTIAGQGGAPDVGGILWGEELDPTVKPLSVGKGFNDNYRAGQQDYGGVFEPTNWPGVRDDFSGFWGPF